MHKKYKNMPNKQKKHFVSFLFSHDFVSIMCNGALMVCLNSLVLANHKQTFIENMLKLVDSTPL